MQNILIDEIKTNLCEIIDFLNRKPVDTNLIIERQTFFNLLNLCYDNSNHSDDVSTLTLDAKYLFDNEYMKLKIALLKEKIERQCNVDANYKLYLSNQLKNYLLF